GFTHPHPEGAARPGRRAGGPCARAPVRPAYGRRGDRGEAADGPRPPGRRVQGLRGGRRDRRPAPPARRHRAVGHRVVHLRRPRPGDRRAGRRGVFARPAPGHRRQAPLGGAYRVHPVAGGAEAGPHRRPRRAEGV
ncbi:MAG: hypothetical protein AVDCRST_MAG83-3583, partial [uncultured Arthrobacter sp.]